MVRRFGNSHAQSAGPEFRVGLLDFPKAGLDPGHENPGFGRLGHGEDHEKLVPAKTTDYIQGAALLPQDLADLNQQPVSSGVAHSVVDHLEAVKIQQENAGVQLMAQAPGDLGGEALLQRATVAEPGELVRGGRAVNCSTSSILQGDGPQRERAGHLGSAPLEFVADARAQHQARMRSAPRRAAPPSRHRADHPATDIVGALGRLPGGSA